MDKKIVIIGAGVSTQYGVLHLLKNGYNPKLITIIDKGNSIYDRLPNEVMTGAGGAGTWSDFKVIPSFKQGGLFYPHYCQDEEYANKLSKQLYDYIVEYHPDPSKIMYTEPVEEPQLIEENNLTTVPKPAQFGVRYETDGNYFTELNKIAYDFKLYKKFGKDSARSFCTNNFAAFVAEEETYGMKSFNGHAHKDPDKANGLTNFGILLEARDIEDPFKFSQDLVNFFQQNGEAAYYSPINRNPSLTDQGTSVPGYKIELEKFKKGFGKYANYILEFIEDLNQTFKINNNYIFYCPEVKFLTNEILLNKEDLSLPQYPNIHLQGDAAGARGIYISALQGLYVAETLLKYKESLVNQN